MSTFHISEAEFANPYLLATLQSLEEAYAEIGATLYVVGAVARDIAYRLLNFDEPARRTLDLDVAVALSEWKQYELLSRILLSKGFEKATQKQKFFYSDKEQGWRYEVDVVPFGTIARNEQVAWPPEGTPVMSVRCFSDIMRDADTITVGDGLSFKLATLSGQWLLKLDAWLDRHLSTKKDATDMLDILKNCYTAYALTRNGLPEDISLDAQNFSLVVAGAEWVASDLKAVLSTEHRSFYSALLSEQQALCEESQLINDLLDCDSSLSISVVQRAIKRMSEILS